jgi:hypothetical protein
MKENDQNEHESRKHLLTRFAIAISAAATVVTSLAAIMVNSPDDRPL